MSSSTKSFEYYSRNNIVNMLEVLDFSEAANTDIIPIKENKVARIQNWINNLNTKSDSKSHNSIKILKCIDLKDLQLKINELLLPELEIVHYMSLQEISAYETMLLEKLSDIKSDQKTVNISATFENNHKSFNVQI
jgi:hypothetical protein